MFIYLFNSFRRLTFECIYIFFLLTFCNLYSYFRERKLRNKNEIKLMTGFPTPCFVSFEWTGIWFDFYTFLHSSLIFTKDHIVTAIWCWILFLSFRSLAYLLSLLMNEFLDGKYFLFLHFSYFYLICFKA